MWWAGTGLATEANETQHCLPLTVYVAMPQRSWSGTLAKQGLLGANPTRECGTSLGTLQAGSLSSSHAGARLAILFVCGTARNESLPKHGQTQAGDDRFVQEECVVRCVWSSVPAIFFEKVSSHTSPLWPKRLGAAKCVRMQHRMAGPFSTSTSTLRSFKGKLMHQIEMLCVLPPEAGIPWGSTIQEAGLWHE